MNLKPFCLIVVLLTGCSILAPMSAENVRAAIDECRDLNLDVLVYERADGSVVDIRCLPTEEEADHKVLVRPRVPVRLLNKINQQ